MNWSMKRFTLDSGLHFRHFRGMETSRAGQKKIKHALRPESIGGRKGVLFVGDINVDLVMAGLKSPPVVDREIICERFEVTMGSSAAICACAFAALGGRALFYGLAGKDDYGEFMLKGFQSFGVDTGWVQRTDRVRTGVTVNLIYKNTRSQVTYPGTIAAFDGGSFRARNFGRIRHIHFAGPYQQTLFCPTLTQWLKRARANKITTSLDPQWDATERWRYMDEWLPLLDRLFINEAEACSLTGALTPEAACRKLAGLTACPVIKAGRRGAFAVKDGAILHQPGFSVPVVDTTGAGDTFDAAFLYAVMDCGMPLEKAMRFANAAGSRCCQFMGGVAARSSYKDIIKLMESVPSATADFVMRKT